MKARPKRIKLFLRNLTSSQKQSLRTFTGIPYQVRPISHCLLWKFNYYFMMNYVTNSVAKNGFCTQYSRPGLARNIFQGLSQVKKLSTKLCLYRGSTKQQLISSSHSYWQDSAKYLAGKCWAGPLSSSLSVGQEIPSISCHMGLYNIAGCCFKDMN